ncbi:MAG: cobyric acid synthase CobQ [Desulfobulbus propionicus]|nr:MAG: cobyric acid synthase CobQ [Desulfobulbus propionicus]
MISKAKCISILGTGSDVGKSIVTTALCRILAQQGVRVAPFKSQNMSNNSGVTPEGLEMGRAQIVQAEAARIPPHVDMNPVLLKPTSDVGSQIVLNGRAWLEATSKSFYEQKAYLFQESCAALDRLRREYEVVVMEGAGSCAEVNLMKNDIVNLRAAAYADAPVVLVGDIDRGGIFAQMVGTLACIGQEDQQRIKGFIINRFRGDITLFQPGVAWIEQQTGKKVFGVLPWYKHFHIEAEDAVTIESPPLYAKASGLPAIGVIKLPHISNFTDFDPLLHIAELQLAYLQQPQELLDFKAIILPGSKSTRSDLDWLEKTGWTRHILAFADRGGHVLGVCGGYQMLGSLVHDPDGIEGHPGSTSGLGLLPVETVLKAPKTTTLTDFSWQGKAGCGYEIHMGQTRLTAGRPAIMVHSRNGAACDACDGCISENGRIIGTYLHGLFDSPDITEQWLASLGLDMLKPGQLHGPSARDKAYDQLAEHAEKHLDVTGILALAGLKERQPQ